MIGVLFHPAETQGTDCLDQICTFLDREGIPHWEIPRDSQESAANLARTRLILTLGGDGTFMHGARMAAPKGIPVLGVNLGRLGFLTELEPSELIPGVQRYLAGDFRVEERIVIHAHLQRSGKTLARLLAINEVVVSKGPLGKLIRLQIDVDGHEVGTIDADGVLVATATGSTAYSLALGGPILEPELKGLVLVPMNPFALTVRPIVFPPGESLAVTLHLGDGTLAADGAATRPMKREDTVRVEPFSQPLKVVRFGDSERFFERLRNKIGWGMPLVPLR